MRQSRIAKYRKKYKGYIMFTQFTVAIYALLVSISLLTSTTVAYYSQDSQVSTTIATASDWYDKSELAFVRKNTEVIHSCPQVDLSVTIKNNKETMTSSTKYEIYYSEQEGNPEKFGQKIAEGKIAPLQSGESTDLVFKAEKEGWYQFKAYQRIGFNNNYEDVSQIWSHKIKVQCSGNQNAEKELDEDQVEDSDSDKQNDVSVEGNKTIDEQTVEDSTVEDNMAEEAKQEEPTNEVQENPEVKTEEDNLEATDEGTNSNNQVINNQSEQASTDETKEGVNP
ncbi:amyloid fiber anchoring/assembly protein TapA [Ornithinibacillus contaminans]|uniref:amyloid fiber anchoring/assembly protein TapA n=1 Tax=Ornithinibacillus contaminans TaxID=694055 RepID=UPI00064D776F|nr:amyloid fiber anchoring/assembly protein TapA [Ornithinibacillus contaminans]